MSSQSSDFYNSINAICVEELGFESNIFNEVLYLPDIKERVLNDILYPEFGIVEPQPLHKRFIFKFRRWKANSWKHKLCYEESLWSSFWNGVLNHLIKPF